MVNNSCENFRVWVMFAILIKRYRFCTLSVSVKFPIAWTAIGKIWAFKEYSSQPIIHQVSSIKYPQDRVSVLSTRLGSQSRHLLQWKKDSTVCNCVKRVKAKVSIAQIPLG